MPHVYTEDELVAFMVKQVIIYDLTDMMVPISEARRCADGHQRERTQEWMRLERIMVSGVHALRGLGVLAG